MCLCVFTRHVGRMIKHHPSSSCFLPLAATSPLCRKTHTQGVCKRGWGASIYPPPPVPHGPRLCTPPAGAPHPPCTGIAPPHLCAQTGDTGMGTQGGTQKVCPSIWPEPEPPMICTGQGAQNAPPPLWLTPTHVQTGASHLPPNRAQERVYAQHAAPSPICEKGAGMGCHVSYMVPPPCTPHLSPLCPPSPLCMQCSMQTGEVQRGGMQRQVVCPLPLLLHGPHLCAPLLAHPLPLLHAGFVPPASVHKQGMQGST
jgi:hypothetical protein